MSRIQWAIPATTRWLRYRIRSAELVPLSHDSTNTNLVSTTDVIGLQSKMFYDTSNTFISSLQTPYGTTTFSQYTPTPSSYPTRGLRIQYPDGTTSVVETWFGHEPYNATFIWDREAMELYPNDATNHDFSHCQKNSMVMEVLRTDICGR